jgi:hypothetical protein
MTDTKKNMPPSLPSTPDRLPSGDDFDAIVRIKVGKEDATEVFEIHKGLLKFYSGYFGAQVSNIEEGRFAEGAANMITVDEDVAVFKAFKNWLYTRSLPPPTDAVSAERYPLLVQLWCFGDRRVIPLLQNECVNKLLSVMQANTEVASGQLRYIYPNTLDDSPLRKFFITRVASRLSGAWGIVDKGRNGANWSEESLRDLAALLLLRPKIETWDELKARVCDWHVHEEGVKCKK